MTDDSAVRREILRLASMASPPPGFRERVLATVAANAVPARFQEPRRFRLMRGAALVASFVLGSLVIGVLVGARATLEQTGGPSAMPARDPAVAAYSSQVDRDVGQIDRDYSKLTCKTRVACAGEIRALNAETEILLEDLSTTPVPPQQAVTSNQLIMAAHRFVAELDVALATIQRPGTDYVSASTQVSIGDLDMAAARVACWPRQPFEGEHGISCS